MEFVPIFKPTFSFSSFSRSSSSTVTEVDSDPPGLAEGSDDEDEPVEDIVDLDMVPQEDVPDKSFNIESKKVAGNIARQEFRNFWLHELKADVWTVKLLEEGYRLPFREEPGQYQERNNKSARQEKPYLIESVASLRDRGVVKKLRCRPWCTNPLTVSSRLVDGKVKKRLCIDLSRHVNLFLKLEAMTMTTLDKSLALVQPGDWMATFDLTSAFHHVPIHPVHHRFLGFSIENEDGIEEFYAYTCMPFGLATATQCLARVTKAICRYAGLQGIRNCLYIDDGRIGAATRALCTSQLEEMLSIWSRAGFVIAIDKTDTPDTISQQKQYLGFIIDSTAMRVTASSRKLTSVRDAISALLCHPGKAPAKEVASVIGKVIALEPAFGSVVHLLTRTAQQELSLAVQLFNWKTRVFLSPQTKKCLQHFASHLMDFNGTLIANLHNAVPLSVFLEPTRFTQDRSLTGDPVAFSAASVVASDASDSGFCHYSIRHKSETFSQGLFNAEESAFSSGHRELLAVLKTLQDLDQPGCRHPFQDTHILWLTDSSNLCTFLSKGSKKPSIQADVLLVHWICHDLSIRLTPIHLKRDDYRIQVADAGSRFFDPDDWALDRTSFRTLTADSPIDADLFAHTSNAKAKRFFSYGLCPRTSGVDAFAQDWSDLVAWACPPINLIIPAVKKICVTRMSGILVVPLWRSALFWTTLLPDGRHFIPQCWKVVKIHPHIVRGQYCYNPLMQGTTAFPFLALHFVSAGTGYQCISGSLRCPF